MIKTYSLPSILRNWLLLGLLLAGANALAGPDWLSVNRAVVDEHLIPRYQQLAESTAILSDKATRFCSAPNQEQLTSLRAAYHQAMDDWMGIQHIRFGPVEMYLRYNRYQMWPDKHSTGPKQLRRFLSKQDQEVLAADKFAHTSVAIQGFSTLERLLFPGQLTLGDFGAPGNPAYRCDLLVAIADNLANMSAGIVRDWQPGDVAFRDQILGAESGNDYFESSQEVSTRLLNDLHTQLQSIVDQKLLRPLERYQMRRAESWRSRRSLRNILLNLKATHELYVVGFAPLLADRELDRKIRDGFKTAIHTTEAITPALYEIAQESEEHGQVKALLEETRRLKRLVASELPPAVGLSLGFNSLDGD
ncbi:imelysin family protein [Sedimenticola thiotaurini]|uniref:Imelysin-like domain-containing protein n=1 Tax=Sedimenticola thiotaurini TaxID=1543721 RepID=A0A0F7JZX2_9GAMM|nr:imelysin family protein [Sedimenticola thiotaurini]AKH20168.1 hypothetical protein AAY24_07150 [Sedimenticola thiotaurini]